MIEKIVDRRTASAWQRKFEPYAPKVGDLAPDFALRDSNGENPLRLSESVDSQPAALIFGSFT